MSDLTVGAASGAHFYEGQPVTTPAQQAYMGIVSAMLQDMAKGSSGGHLTKWLSDNSAQLKNLPGIDVDQMSHWAEKIKGTDTTKSRARVYNILTELNDQISPPPIDSADIAILLTDANQTSSTTFDTKVGKVLSKVFNSFAPAFQLTAAQKKAEEASEAGLMGNPPDFGKAGTNLATLVNDLQNNI